MHTRTGAPTEPARAIHSYWGPTYVKSVMGRGLRWSQLLGQGLCTSRAGLAEGLRRSTVEPCKAQGLTADGFKDMYCIRNVHVWYMGTLTDHLSGD